MARSLRELLQLKEDLDEAALASLLRLARSELLIAAAHLAVAELEWTQAHTRASLRAVREARAQYRRQLALIMELEPACE